MAVLKGAEIERFLRSPPDHVRAVLVYGPDRGLVSERAARIAKSFLGAEAGSLAELRIGARDLADDPGRLTDALGTGGLFAARWAVHVRPDNQKIDKILADALDTMAPDTLLVVQTDNLTPASPLRKLFEADKRCAALACYVDDARGLEKLIEQEVRDAGLTIEPDAKAALLAELGGDRLATRGELAKLILYVKGKSVVTLADVEAAVGDVSGWALDEVFDAAGSGDCAGLDRLLAKAFAAGTAPAQIVAGALRHFLALHALRAEIDGGCSAADAVARAKPPVFFKRRGAMERQGAAWRRDLVEQALERLHEAERLSRRSDGLAKAAVGQALLAIAAASPARERRRAAS